jgi:hypothetical protein
MTNNEPVKTTFKMGKILAYNFDYVNYKKEAKPFYKSGIAS